MTSAAVLFDAPVLSASTQAVAEEARRGLTASPRTLLPWLFYDEAGSRLFEDITALPEYYLTRTERDLFTTHAADIFAALQCPASRRDVDTQTRSIPIAPTSLALIELGAGTASKTGILLRALTQLQPHVQYQPIDISPSALDAARVNIERAIPGVAVRPVVANYVTDGYRIDRPARARILALYIGSSIGNFSPEEAHAILTRLRSQLQPGDALLLGADLAPSATKPISTLLAAYNDKAGVTAAFNRNILHRLNRDLGANFRPDRFHHRALWNTAHSRIEMHLASAIPQVVDIPANSAGPALTLRFRRGESIHTENSYKFTSASICAMLTRAGFSVSRTFTDTDNLFAVTLATAI